MFNIITPASYWVLTVLWLVILGLYIFKFRQSAKVGGAIAVLVTVLAIDAFRTVFESIYFGLYFNSSFGFLPGGIFELLSSPQLLVIPKLVNAVAGFIVLFILLRGWIPRTISERNRAEAALQANRTQLKLIFEIVSDIIFVIEVTPYGEFLFAMVNPMFLRATGLSEDQVVGKRVQEIIPEPALAYVLAKYKEAIDNKKPVQWEETSEYPGGKKTGHVTIFPVLDANSRCVQLVGTVHDITERKEMEEALRKGHVELEQRVLERTEQLKKSQERFRDIAESSSDWFWEMGPDLKFTYFTESLRDIAGIDPKDLLGFSRQELVSERENSEKWEKHLEDLNNHRSFRNYRYEIQRPDGSTQYISISGKPVFKQNGEFEGYRGTGTNRTRQRFAENYIRKLSLAVEQSPNAVFITDTQGAIEYINTKFTELTGYTAEEAIGQNPRILKSDETSEEPRSDPWKTILPGKEWRGEIYHRRKDGTLFWVNETIAPVTNEEGEITNYVATHEDISERKEAEFAAQSALNQAEIANRAKSELLANMSHELRTPLNAIIGFSGSLKEETFGPVGSEKNREYLDDIHHSGQHLLELINDILDVSAVEAGALELDEEDVNLTDVVETSVRIIRPRADNGQVRVASAIDSEIPMIYADARRVKQVFLNLLSNAVKFTSKGGDVTVSAQLNDDRSLAGVVADTGVGMTEEEVIKALSTFGQVDSGLDRKHEGTGLGLPLTKALMELHGGTLEIKSEKGNGTTVTVTFPKERVIQHV